jgi:NAD(P)-dependent dehydrogenase (short-subunit alcohol dehydrogenase family)
VYVTGRTTAPGQASLPGTIQETADQVTAAGGRSIAVRCNHAEDSDIARLFAQVEADSGRLDILVNNAAFIHDALIEPQPFWQKPIELAEILNVGLRSHYIACYHAAPIMVRQRRGLITFSSSFGAVCYMHGAAYGAQKAGVDKFAADMAVDLKEYGVATASIWMGPLRTERTDVTFKSHKEQYAAFIDAAETPGFTGELIDALYNDPELMSLSGKTFIGAELALRYRLKDAGGKQPPSYREMLGSPREPHPAIVR